MISRPKVPFKRQRFDDGVIILEQDSEAFKGLVSSHKLTFTTAYCFKLLKTGINSEYLVFTENLSLNSPHSYMPVVSEPRKSSATCM